ncbi:family 43 glycosylhydrolase [Streptomyces sp. 7R007]
MARSRTPNGPYEPCPANPVLTQHRPPRAEHRPRGPGPGSRRLLWTVFLGVRPHGGTPGGHVLRRETFLAQPTWGDGWPVVGEVALDPPAPPCRSPPAPAPADEHRE